MDRRQFFKEVFRRTADSVRSLNQLEKKELPPGASPNFYSLCTGCDACMAACPVNVIMIEDLEKRYPVIYPEKDPCISCPGFPCIAACPTAALSARLFHPGEK